MDTKNKRYQRISNDDDNHNNLYNSNQRHENMELVVQSPKTLSSSIGGNGAVPDLPLVIPDFLEPKQQQHTTSTSNKPLFISFDHHVAVQVQQHQNNNNNNVVVVEEDDPQQDDFDYDENDSTCTGVVVHDKNDSTIPLVTTNDDDDDDDDNDGNSYLETNSLVDDSTKQIRRNQQHHFIQNNNNIHHGSELLINTGIGGNGSNHRSQQQQQQHHPYRYQDNPSPILAMHSPHHHLVPSSFDTKMSVVIGSPTEFTKSPLSNNNNNINNSNPSRGTTPNSIVLSPLSQSTSPIHSMKQLLHPLHLDTINNSIGMGSAGGNNNSTSTSTNGNNNNNTSILNIINDSDWEFDDEANIRRYNYQFSNSYYDSGGGGGGGMNEHSSSSTNSFHMNHMNTHSHHDSAAVSNHHHHPPSTNTTRFYLEYARPSDIPLPAEFNQPTTVRELVYSLWYRIQNQFTALRTSARQRRAARLLTMPSEQWQYQLHACFLTWCCDATDVGIILLTTCVILWFILGLVLPVQKEWWTYGVVLFMIRISARRCYESIYQQVLVRGNGNLRTGLWMLLLGYNPNHPPMNNNTTTNMNAMSTTSIATTTGTTNSNLSMMSRLQMSNRDVQAL